MAQELRQQQVQRQVQKLSPQQFLVSKLLELPLTELEQRVQDEVYENIALEESAGETAEGAQEEDSLPDTDDTLEEASDGDDSNDLDELIETEELPVYTSRSREPENDLPIGDTKSFIEELEAQIGEYEVDDRQRTILHFLIGSLDDRGFIDRPLRALSDDLLFTTGLDASIPEIEEALHTLQQFDPCGIGARSLQECLLLQIDHLIEQLDNSEADAHSLRQRETMGRARILVADHFRLFERNERERLAAELHCSEAQLSEAIAAIAKLNPHPGRSLHEAADDRVQTILPDFIVETDHEHSISLTLNTGGIPTLRISEEYATQLKAYQNPAAPLGRSEKEAYTYTRQKVEAARLFIAALRQRQHTLRSTMRAIIELQRPFILSQDETTLRPMRLADVAQRTGLDISTISRVASSKYVLLDGTIYPLKHFFLRTKQSAAGEQVVRTEVEALLQEIIDGEDKQRPLSDDQLQRLMSQRGVVISRRTVAKYRNAMKIPTAPLRRQS